MAGAASWGRGYIVLLSLRHETQEFMPIPGASGCNQPAGCMHASMQGVLSGKVLTFSDVQHEAFAVFPKILVLDSDGNLLAEGEGGGGCV